VVERYTREVVLMRMLLTILMLAAAALCGCSGKPPIRVSDTSGGVVVDVQSLGEYPTDVKKVRLSRANTGEVVWELNANETQGRVPQLARFPLYVGPNQAQIKDVLYGTYVIVVPRNRDTFSLQRGVQYELTVWGDSGRSNKAMIYMR
jgi:hypothetical protein